MHAGARFRLKHSISAVDRAVEPAQPVLLRAGTVVTVVAPVPESHYVKVAVGEAVYEVLRDDLVADGTRENV
jgi:hypothetical protein